MASSPHHLSDQRQKESGPSLKKRRACDSCSSLKEKCIYTTSTVACDRCQRLSKRCCTDRLPQSLYPFGSVVKNLKHGEEYMLTQLLDLSNFGAFVVVKGVAKEMHQQAVRSLLCDYNGLSDGMYAMFGAFTSAKHPALPDSDKSANLRRGTVALRRFSVRLCPEMFDDFVPWLWLGVSIVIHAFCALGSSASPVRRHILGHLLGLKDMGRDFTCHPVIVSLIMVDIMESLIYGDQPTMNIPEGYPLGKDSFYGLALQLWRFMYDLCGIRSAMLGQEAVLDPDADMLLALSKLEADVEHWHPDSTSDTLESLTKIEIVHFSTQIHVLRTAILLIIHRIRYPFGEQDALAHRMARTILSDLELATTMTGYPPPFVTLPFLVAAMESLSTEDRQSVVAQVQLYVEAASPTAQAMAVTFLKALWGLRDLGEQFRWIEVMDSLPLLCIRP